MKTKNKLTSIASYGNFNQFSSSGLGLESSLTKYIDSNIEQPMGKLTGQPFIPNQPNKRGHENLSANPTHDCIHELSDEDGSAHDYDDEPSNLPFSQSKRKVLSYDNTKNPQVKSSKDEIIVSERITETKPTTEPQNELSGKK